MPKRRREAHPDSEPMLTRSRARKAGIILPRAQDVPLPPRRRPPRPKQITSSGQRAPGEAPQAENPVTTESGLNTQNKPQDDIEMGNNSGIRVDCQARKRTQPFFVTEKVLDKPDIFTERKIVSRQNQAIYLDSIKEKEFTVVSYNIRPEPESAWENEMSLRGYGPEILHIYPNYYDRLRKEIQTLQADILCLQSVSDTHYEMLKVDLPEYKSYRVRRGSGFGDFSEVTFFLTSRFTGIKGEEFMLHDLIIEQAFVKGVDFLNDFLQSVSCSEVVLILTLKCKITGTTFRCCNTRIANSFKQRPDLQAVQVCSILKEAVSTDSTSNLPFLLCGDFDCRPNDHQYQVLRTGLLSEDARHSFTRIRPFKDPSTEEEVGVPLVKMYPAGFHHDCRTLVSAYELIKKEEPRTCWHRESEMFLQGSYVWVDGQRIGVSGILEMLPAKIVTLSGTPNEFLPSTNLSLKAVLAFL